MTKTHGLLRWKAMPMGFKNASAYFQREIDAALRGLNCCVTYIDDVVIHSSGSFEDHLKRLKPCCEHYVRSAFQEIQQSASSPNVKLPSLDIVWLMEKYMH